MKGPSHSAIDESIQRYFDGDMSLREARRFRATLAEDPVARAKLEVLTETRHLLQEGLTAAAEQADFSELFGKIQQRIRKAPEPSLLERLQAWIARNRRPLALASAAVVAGVMGLAIGARPWIFGAHPRGSARSGKHWSMAAEVERPQQSAPKVMIADAGEGDDAQSGSPIDPAHVPARPPLKLAGGPPIVESLEVGEGASSTVFSSDGDSDMGGTTVIWVTESHASGD